MLSPRRRAFSAMERKETSETDYNTLDALKKETLSTKIRSSIRLKTPKTKLCTRLPMQDNEFAAGTLNYWPPEAPFEAPKTSQKWSENHL